METPTDTQIQILEEFMEVIKKYPSWSNYNDALAASTTLLAFIIGSRQQDGIMGVDFNAARQIEDQLIPIVQKLVLTGSIQKTVIPNN